MCVCLLLAAQGAQGISSWGFLGASVAAERREGFLCLFLASIQSCCVFLKIRPPTFSTQIFARKRIGTIARTSRTKSVPLRDLLTRFWDESVRRGRSNAIKFNPETGTTVPQELLLVVPLLQTLRLSPALAVPRPALCGVFQYTHASDKDGTCDNVQQPAGAEARGRKVHW